MASSIVLIMKMSLLLLIGVKLISIDGKLLERTTVTTQAPVQNTKPTRIARDIFDDYSFIVLSKEESGTGGDLIKTFNRRPRYFFRSKFVSKMIPPKAARVVRELGETNIAAKNGTSSKAESTEIKNKFVFVKKPIPKFNDIEYEDEFQTRFNKAPVKTGDSVEHEDEDFNVDDYDFDVNHDEFIGRGKPLEPKRKFKVNKIQHENQPARKQTGINNEEPVKKTEKLIIPVLHLKKERSVGNIIKKAVNKTKVDKYYDNFSSTVTPKPKSTVDDEMAGENEDMNSKASRWGSGRAVRSPWDFNAYVDKFSDKVSLEIKKFLSILQLFPQAASKVKI